MTKGSNELEFEKADKKRNNRRAQQDSSDDSDYERIPNMLTLKTTMSIDTIKMSFADMPELLKKVLPEKARKTNAIKD